MIMMVMAMVMMIIMMILANGGHDKNVAVEEYPGYEEEKTKHLRWS